MIQLDGQCGNADVAAVASSSSMDTIFGVATHGAAVVIKQNLLVDDAQLILQDADSVDYSPLNQSTFKYGYVGVVSAIVDK